MRTSWIPAIALSLFLFSCQKNEKLPETNPQNEAKVPVKFSVSGFNQQVTDIDGRKADGTNILRDSLLETKITHLYYTAYSENAGYMPVSSKHQDATVNNFDFGSIADTLPPGNYIIIMVGSKGPSGFGGQSPVYGDTKLTLLPGVKGPARLPDTYFKKFSIHVTSDTLPYSNITLSRLSSNLEVNILDARYRGPGLDSIEVSISSEASFYSFAFDETGNEQNETVVRYISKKNLNTYSDYVLSTSAPFSVSIKYIDRIANSFFIKKIDNVRCYRNKKTTLTGNIFEGGSGSADGFKMSVNDTWEADAPVIPF